jgi:prefoldin subunit 5
MAAMADMYDRDKGNIADRESLKVAEAKLREIYAVLDKLDEIIELLSFYNTDEAKAVHDVLINYRDTLKELAKKKDELILVGGDLAKGTYNGDRKLDIDLALNKRGVKEAKTTQEALAIWKNEQTTVYYDKAWVEYNDGTVITITFKNNENANINISTSSELVYQLKINTDFNVKTVNTAFIPDASGKVDSLGRLVDIAFTSSNIKQIKLNALSGDFIEKNPAYTWFDTTSVLSTLFEMLPEIEKAKSELEEIKEVINDFMEVFNQAFIEIDLTSQLDGNKKILSLGNIVTQDRVSLLFHGGVLLPQADYSINHTNHTLTTVNALDNSNDKELKLFLITDITTFNLSSLALKDEVNAVDGRVNQASSLISNLTQNLSTLTNSYNDTKNALSALANSVGLTNWDSAKTYAANVYVQYGGKIYISLQASNTNKNPSSQTAYWREAFVSLSANQTIAGTKTFTSAVVIPAPTGDTHAATKKYVDDNKSKTTYSLVGDVLYITDDTDND